MGNLLNYTTEVPASRSIGQIQGMLVEAGARKIASDYNDKGLISALMFAVETPYGLQAFSLPVHTEKVLAVLQREKPRSKYSTPEHAERVAWRIMKDWVEAQLAIIRTEMVTLDQVMLPYMHSKDGKLVYELIVEQQLALGSGE